MAEVRWINRIKEWREARGLTIEEAAEALRLSLYIYRRCELGEIEPPATALCLIPGVFRVTRKEAFATAEVA